METKQLILHGLYELLEEYTIDSITVQMLADYCHINRNTFYYYYDSIYSMLEDDLHRELEVIREYIKQGETWEDCFRATVGYILDHKTIITHLVDSISRELLQNHLESSFEVLISEFVYKRIENRDVDDEEVKFVIAFVKHAFVGFTLEWCDNGFDEESSVQFLTHLSNLMEKNIAIIWS